MKYWIWMAFLLIGLLFGLIYPHTCPPLEDHNDNSSKLCEEKGGVPVWERDWSTEKERYDHCEVVRK